MVCKFLNPCGNMSPGELLFDAPYWIFRLTGKDSRHWDEMYTEEGILEIWASITSVLGRRRLGKVEGFGTVVD